MFTRLTIALSEEEWQALETMAAQDMRGLRDQARFVLSAELRRHGLLPQSGQNGSFQIDEKEDPNVR